MKTGSAPRVTSRRRFIGELALMAGAAPFLADGAAAQNPARVPHIGYCLTINADTARKTGLTLPPGLLAQAERVIQASGS